MALVSDISAPQSPKWPDIAKSDTFQNLDINDQEALRSRYYEKVVAPAKPAGLDDNAYKQGFFQKSIEHDSNTGVIGQDDALNRFNRYGVRPSEDMNISSAPTLKDIGNAAESFGGGVEKGLTNVGTGLLKTAVDFDTFIHLTSPDAKAQFYTAANKGSEAMKETIGAPKTPIAEDVGQLGVETVPFIAAAPEIAPIKGAGMLKNALNAGVKLSPSMGATAYATSNAPSTEGKAIEGAVNAAATTPTVVAGSVMLAALGKLGGMAIDKLAPIFSENARQGKLSQSLSKTNEALGTSNEEVAQNIEQGQAQTVKVAPSANPTTTQLSSNSPTLVGLQNSPSLPSAQRQAIVTREQQASNVLGEQAQGQNIAQTKPNSPPVEIQTAGDIKSAKINAEGELANVNTEVNKAGPELTQNNKDLLSNQMTNVAGRAAQTSEPYSLNNKLTDERKSYEANNVVPKSTLEDTFDDKSVNALQSIATVDKNAEGYLKSVGFQVDNAGVLQYNGTKRPSIEDMRKLGNYLTNIPAETFDKPGISYKLKGQLQKIGTSIEDSINTHVLDTTTGIHIADVNNISKGGALSNVPMKNPNNLSAVLNPDANYKAALEANKEQVPIEKAPQVAANAPTTPTNFNVEGNKNPYTIGTNDRTLENIRSGAVENKAIPTIVSERFTAGQNGAQAVKDYLGQIKGADSLVGDTLTNKILQEATTGGEFNADKAKTLITDNTNGYGSHISSLEPRTADSIRSKVNALADIYSSKTGLLDRLKPFADWLANINDDKVYSNALKSFDGVNSLRSSVSDLSKDTQDGVNALLRQKYFEQPNVMSSERVPDAHGNMQTKLSLNPKFLKDVNTPGTENYKIFETLYDTPKDARAVRDTLDLAERYQAENGNVKLSSDQVGKVAKDIAKAGFFHAGGRLGTSAYVDNAFATIFNQKYGEIINKVLNDPEYAKQILRMKVSNEEGPITKLLQDYGLTSAVSSGIIQNKEENSRKSAKPVVGMDSTPMSDLFTEAEHLNEKPEGGGNAFKDFERYQKDTLLPPPKYSNKSNMESGLNQKKSNPALDTIEDTDTGAIKDMITYGKNDTIARNLKLEGGYVNNPSDPGGATNLGITLNTLRRVKPNATVQDVKKLTPAIATSIYDKLYWSPNKIDQMPEQVQDVAFDSFVQHGDEGGAKLIQRALANMGQPVSVDGKIGDDTIAAMSRVEPDALRKQILGTREQFYRHIAASNPSQKKFLNGWLNRLDALT